MKPFMFVIDGVPLPENPNYTTVGGAKIHIWVMDEDVSSAQMRAITLIKQTLWKVQDIAHAFEIQPEVLPNLETAEALLYRKALQNGIAAEFLAFPRVDGSPDDPLLIGQP